MIIDGRTLTVADLTSAAVRPAGVSLSDEARARAAASHEFARLAAGHRPIYGRSTGVGANRTVSIADDPEALRQAALGLLRSHATSAGELRAPERVRAMLLVRLNQLAAGGSGADPRLLEVLAHLISADALPPVRELGGIGTGDLSALATAALAIEGEVPTLGPDGPPGGYPAMPAFRFGLGDALPFLSSNAATLADAALGLDGLRRLAEAVVVVAALSFSAVDGNDEAFASAVEQVTPFEGARWVCRSVRALVDPVPAARIQDPFGLRTLPQVHGAFVDALAALERTVLALMNTSSENPVLSPELGVAHHGGFHAAYLAQALDAVALAAAQSAQLSLARLTMLDEPALTGRAPFLGDGTPGASGTMIVEYVSASALAALRALAVPASLQSVTLSRGVEEDASFASLAARQVLDSIALFRTVLAGELVAAVRCIRLRGLTPSVLRPVLDAAAELDREAADRNLTGDLDVAGRVVDALPGLLAQIMSSSGRSSSA
ncbi:MAG: histidine ammonia-lyase [Pseudonocardiales bacterium]|nr:histidine ammonia-lyase [Pseudonocardiales bacterium]